MFISFLVVTEIVDMQPHPYTSMCFYHQVISKLAEVNFGDVVHSIDGLNVIYGDESLPRLYENSELSSEQLQSRSGK